MNYEVLYNKPKPNELYHHGVKGQKWGVRRYQNYDGSYTKLGYERIRNRFSSYEDKLKTINTGKQYVDECIKSGTTLKRIQTSKNFENYAFYATYLKSDVNKYYGLFGSNLKKRAIASAKSQYDSNAKSQYISKIKSLKIYQLHISTTKNLKVPSIKHAGDITAKLLKEKEFKDDLQASIKNAKASMRRPAQQILFAQAQRALNKEASNLSTNDKIAIYKALNLTLTFHDDTNVRIQNKLYSTLKKNGYSALLDYNDKEYSSYHAKRPMIIFDTQNTKLDHVEELNDKRVDRLYMHYNTIRLINEAFNNTVGNIGKILNRNR